MYAYLGKSYHGSTEKCDGLVSLLSIILIHDCVRIMLLDGYNFSRFVVVVSCFQGERDGKTSVQIVWKKRKHKRCAS